MRYPGERLIRTYLYDCHSVWPYRIRSVLGALHPGVENLPEHTCPERMVKESELFHMPKRRFREACSSFPLCAKLCSGEGPLLFSLAIRPGSTRDAGREWAGLLRVWLCPHARCILVQTVTKRQGGLQMQFPSRGFHAHQPSLLRKRSKAEMKAILSFEEHRGLGRRGAGNAPEVTG